MAQILDPADTFFDMTLEVLRPAGAFWARPATN
jgi:hypothetical protein